MTQIVNVANAVDIPDLLGGELMEALKAELTRVVQNIADPNTMAAHKRTISMQMDLMPNVQRDYVDVLIKVRSSCNAHNPAKRASLLLSIAPGREGVLHVSVTEHSHQQQSLFEPAPESRYPTPLSNG